MDKKVIILENFETCCQERNIRRYRIAMKAMILYLFESFLSVNDFLKLVHAIK